MDLHPAADEATEAFLLRRPTAPSVPIVVTNPHAGRAADLPDDIDLAGRLRLPPHELDRRGDTFTDQLCADVTGLGVHQLVSLAPPWFLNVGRSLGSLSPSQAAGTALTPDPDDIYAPHGQGLISESTYHDKAPIYRGGCAPDGAEVAERIRRFYEPFHARLAALVDELVQAHGTVLVFDVHSCPTIGAASEPNPGARRPDVIFSNRGTPPSCDPDLVGLAAKHANRTGLSVGINHVFRGGFITVAHSRARPGSRTSSLQLEVCRGAYGLDEQTLEIADPSAFDQVRGFITDLVAAFAKP